MKYAPPSALILCAALGACVALPPGGYYEPVGAETIVRLNESTPDDVPRTVIVVRSAEGFAAFWNDYHRFHLRGGGMPPLPRIDFSRETAIIASAGPQTAHDVAVERVEHDDVGLLVQITEIVPGGHCAYVQAMTTPVHIVRVPKHAGVVRYVWRRRALDCD